MLNFRELMRLCVAVLALGLVLATPLHAQVQRTLPTQAKLGELVGQQHPYPLVQINGEVLHMSPGALIHDQNNRTILHNYLPSSAQVLYLIDAGGQVSRIIILTPEELARLEAARR